MGGQEAHDEAAEPLQHHPHLSTATHCPPHLHYASHTPILATTTLPALYLLRTRLTSSLWSPLSSISASYFQDLEEHLTPQKHSKIVNE